MRKSIFCSAFCPAETGAVFRAGGRLLFYQMVMEIAFVRVRRGKTNRR